MTPAQLNLVPNHLLRPHNTPDLIAWLHDRGWRMSLLELDHERRDRGLIRRTTR